MAGFQITRQLLRMRRDWNRRARENARHYVVTGQHQWTDEEFYQSGLIAMEEEILNDLPNVCQGRDPKDMRVLEIGCGAGRVTRGFAGLFRGGQVGGAWGWGRHVGGFGGRVGGGNARGGWGGGRGERGRPPPGLRRKSPRM